MQKILNLKHGTQKAMFFVFFLLCSAVMMAQNKVSGTVLGLSDLKRHLVLALWASV